MQSASLLMHTNEVLFTEIIKNNNKKSDIARPFMPGYCFK